MYKIKIKKSFGAKLIPKSKVYLGISLSNEVFWRHGFKKLLNYASYNFNKPMIIIADYLYRHNIMITHGVNEQQAIELAKKIGDDYKMFLQSIISNMEKELSCHIIVVHFQNLWLDIKANEIFSVLQEIYNTNEIFKIDVDETINNYISYQSNNNSISIVKTKAFELSKKFIFE